MTISLQDAVEIHARALLAGGGFGWATSRAMSEALRCKARGDDEGYGVWLQVRDALWREVKKDDGRTVH